MNDNVLARKRERAAAILADKKIGRWYSVSPLHHLLWKMKIAIPPPLFSPFWLNFLMSASLYALMMPLLLFLPSSPDLPADNVALMPDLTGGLIFGLIMATVYQVRRKVCNLPGWEQL